MTTLAPTGTSVHAPAIGRARGTEPLTATDLPRVLTGVAHQARRELLAFHAGRGLGPGDAGLLLPRAAVGSSVDARVVTTDEALGDRSTRDELRQLADRGLRVRTTEALPHWLLLVDRSVAVVAAEPTRDRGDAVLVRDPLVVAGLHALHGSFWGAARPPVRQADREAPTPRQVEVLELMSSGLTDDRAADRLGVCTRTYRRDVARLLDRLGARSRFQAGLLAAERGWV